MISFNSISEKLAKIIAVKFTVFTIDNVLSIKKKINTNSDNFIKWNISEKAWGISSRPFSLYWRWH